MKHVKLFENWLNESSNWQDMVMSACSEFEINNPGALEKLTSADADTIMNDDKLMDLYNQAAQCVVEPDQAIGDQSANMSDYYARSEREGLGFVTTVLKERPNGDQWVLLLDLIEEIGY